MKVFCGIDWAEDHHDVALVDVDRALVAKRRIGDSAVGFAELTALLADAGDNADDRSPSRSSGVGVGAGGRQRRHLTVPTFDQLDDPADALSGRGTNRYRRPAAVAAGRWPPPAGWLLFFWRDWSAMRLGCLQLCTGRAGAASPPASSSGRPISIHRTVSTSITFTARIH